MPSELTTEEIEYLRENIGKDVQRILRELESDAPGSTEGFGAITGAGIGAAASLTALSSLGVSGLSSVGVVSGLSAAGSLIGGGIVTGIGVLAAPVVILGIAGYSILKSNKEKKKAAALDKAISELYLILEKLNDIDEYFTEEISGIRAIIKTLQTRA